MTKLGEFLRSKSVNQSEIARKTGLKKARINQLCNNDKTRLAAFELYLILLAIDINPGEPLIELYGHLILKTSSQDEEGSM